MMLDGEPFDLTVDFGDKHQFSDDPDFTVRLVEPPTKNHDGTLSVRGRVSGEGWTFYRFDGGVEIDQDAQEWLAERIGPEGVVALHVSDEVPPGVRGHLTPCEAPIRTFVFDLRSWSVSAR